MAKHQEFRVINPLPPDVKLRKEKELHRLVAEVLVRKQRRLAAEAAAQAATAQELQEAKGA